MLVTEIKDLTKSEVVELLKVNTAELKIQDNILIEGYEQIYASYALEQNYVLEEKDFWSVVLSGFFNFDTGIIDTLFEVLGTYALIAWCADNLLDNSAIKHYYDGYKAYHTEKSSVAEILGAFISAFIDDLGELKPESLIDYAKDLGKQLDKLPAMVKEQIK